MAVTKCYPAERKGTVSLKGLRQVATAKVKWLIETDVMQGWIDTFTQAKAVTAPMIALPQIGQSYNLLGESDQYLFCNRLDFENPSPEKRKAWVCSVTYEAQAPGTKFADFNSDPLQRPIKYWWETEHYLEPVERAVLMQDIPTFGGGGVRIAKGTVMPIQTGAGQDYDETVMKERTRLILVARKNTTDLAGTGQLVIDFDDSTNSEVFFGVGAGQAEFRDISFSDEMTENGVTYWQATFRVALSSQTVYREIVNRGWKYYTALGALTQDTDPVPAEPHLLTAGGQKLGDGLFGNTISYNVKSKSLDYSDLGIGTQVP
jgi:hypothetical protein